MGQLFLVNHLNLEWGKNLCKLVAWFLYFLCLLSWGGGTIGKSRLFFHLQKRIIVCTCFMTAHLAFVCISDKHCIFCFSVTSHFFLFHHPFSPTSDCFHSSTLIRSGEDCHLVVQITWLLKISGSFFFFFLVA